MAVSSSTTTSLLFLIFTSIVALAVADDHDNSDDFTHLRFYIHERVLGTPNATVALPVDLHRNSTGSGLFGNIAVFDNALRVGLDPSSALIGRAQGISVFSDLSGTGGILTTQNLVFTAGEYNGSSLAVTGIYKVGDLSSLSEMSIAGGSGRFRLAGGYALSKVVNLTETTHTAELDVYIV